MEFKAAICPNCGGDLRVPEDKKVLKCMYCGRDIVVEEAINKAQPSLENYLTLAKSAKDSKNYKEAYDYYNKVLELNPPHYEAWLGKAESAGWQTSVKNFRIQEIITCFEKGIKFCPYMNKDAVKKKSVTCINNILVACNNKC